MENNNNNNNNNENILVINSNNNIEFEFEDDDENELLLKNDEKKKEKKLKENWEKSLNIMIVFAILFFGEVARGIVIPTVTIYSNQVGGTAKTLGLIISAFSAGRFIATIVLGYFSKYDNYKNIFNWSILLCIVGSFWYCFAYIDYGNDLMGESSLIISRFILGFGAGTLSCVRSYIADITIPSERTSWIALSSALQFLGFAVSPIFGSLLAYIPTFYIGKIRIDYITLPGWFLTIQNIFLLFFIIIFFKNPTLSQLVCNQQQQIGNDNSNNKCNNSSNNGSDIEIGNDRMNSSSDEEYEHHDYQHEYNGHDDEGSSLKSSDGIVSNNSNQLLIVNSNNQSIYRMLLSDKRTFINLIAYIILNFFIRAVLGIYETIGTPLYNELNGVDGNDNNSGYFFGGLSLAGIGLLFIISWLGKKDLIHDWYVFVAANLVITIGCFATMSHQLTWTRFVIGYLFIWAIGFNLSQTVIVSIFSKVLSSSIGGASQGTLIGIITASGSLGRVVGPLFSGMLYNSNDQLPLFSFAFGLSLFLLISSILMIPKDIAKIKYLNHNDKENIDCNENDYQLIN